MLIEQECTRINLGAERLGLGGELAELNIMKPAEVKYSRNKVNKAGDLLRTLESSSLEDHWTADVLSNWRAIHNYPINTFQATLRHKLKAIDEQALVAQRLSVFLQ